MFNVRPLTQGMMADADVGLSPVAHKRPNGMRGMRGEMMEEAQNTVGFSDHYYRALKTAAEPPWNQWRAKVDVVGAGMTEETERERTHPVVSRGAREHRSFCSSLCPHYLFFYPAVLCGCGKQPTFASSGVELEIKTKYTRPFTEAFHGEERAEGKRQRQQDDH